MYNNSLRQCISDLDRIALIFKITNIDPTKTTVLMTL